MTHINFVRPLQTLESHFEKLGFSAKPIEGFQVKLHSKGALQITSIGISLPRFLSTSGLCKITLEAEVKAIPPAQREALEIKSTYFLTSYLVFNVAQTENLPEIYYQTPLAHQTISFDIAEVVGKLINSFGATEIVTFQEVDSAFYDMKKDRIVMPLDKQFTSEAGYYGTFFHEWVHWTGHASRLNRLFLVERSNENYAHEELIAELGSVFICAQLGLAKDMTQNAAYIQSWLRALKEDSRYIMKMISFSERACRYILNEFNLEETIQEFPLVESEK